MNLKIQINNEIRILTNMIDKKYNETEIDKHRKKLDELLEKYLKEL